MCRSLNFGSWPVREARGIPNCGTSENLGVWVLGWIDLQEAFTPNLIGKVCIVNMQSCVYSLFSEYKVNIGIFCLMQLPENLVRMRIAMDILLGEHSEIRVTLGRSR